MRKATGGLSMRGTRKKQPAANNSSSSDNVKEEQQQQQRAHVAPQPDAEQPPQDMKVHHHRRKPSNTDEVAALTTKNYRLAKELSELRVRHREECKSVTRLTMENMNLASRCREAISHVAMLKKELAMHQKRAAEALAIQREQTQRIASNLSTEMSRLSQSGSEDDGDRNAFDLERIMSPARAPATPSMETREQEQSAEKSSTRHNRTAGSPHGGTQSDLDEDDTVVDTVDSSSPSNETATPKQQEETPKVYSTPNRNRNPDRWKPKVGQDSESPGIFPGSASPKVLTGRPQNYNEEFPPDMISNPRTPTQSSSSLHSRTSTSADDDTSGSEHSRSVSSRISPSVSSSQGSLHSRSIIGMNSIDAFEASFDTKFPAGFASKEESERTTRSGTPISAEIYNPFSPSPARSIENTEMRAAASRSPHGHIPPSPNASPIHPTLASSPTVIRTARVSDSGVFGNPVTPEEKKSNNSSWNDDSYRTPPQEGRSVSSRDSVEPKRPEKAASAAARARYEKAMQPRTSSSSGTKQNTKAPEKSNMSVDTKHETANEKGLNFLKGSPSALLKRIQQRRMNKQLSRQQSAPETGSEPEKVISQPLHVRQKSAPEVSVRNQQYGPLETIDTSLNVVGTVQGEQQERRDSEKSASSSNASERPFDEMEDPLSTGRRDDKTFGPTSPGGAQSISERLNAIKSRRSTKQPVSYAEPSLNTKLRRGDEFFPKSGGTSPIVTPEQVSHAGPVAG